MLRTPVEERFWNKVDAFGVCWEWVARSRTPNGYGVFRLSHEGGTVLAHRFAYALLVGDIPSHLQADHLCRNRLCVDPDHIQLVPQIVNLARGGSPAAINGRKTHCVHGHTLADAHVRAGKNGRTQRVCRTCYP